MTETLAVKGTSLAALEIHGLSQRTMNRLEEAGVEFIEQLGDVEAINADGIGPAHKYAIRQALESFNSPGEQERRDQRIADYKTEVRTQERCRRLAGRLRQANGQHWRLHRKAADAIEDLLEENERLWAQVRRHKQEGGG